MALLRIMNEMKRKRMNEPTPVDWLKSELAWPKLTPGILLRRYNRFLADILLPEDRSVIAHCPNSGSMKSCCEPGRTVYLSKSDNPKRKLAFTWELISMPTSLVGVNTLTPNRLIKHCLEQGSIEAFSDYTIVRPEVKLNPGTRIDFAITGSDRKQCFIEVKNCTLIDHGIAYFPDAITERGKKHLIHLQEQVASGNRAAMIFLVQRCDATEFRPADHIDPQYGIELRKAFKSGVEMYCFDTEITLESIRLRNLLPICM